jgi:cytochrome oxidase assembly protein ShyY1
VKGAQSAGLQGGILFPGLITLVTLAILLGLGLWQVERLAWKTALIAALDARIRAAPSPLPEPVNWSRLSQENSEFRRVTVPLEFLAQTPAYVYASGSALRTDIKAPGYFVFVPARLESGEIVVVNVGYGPEPRDPARRGTSEITGYLRWPESPSWFVSAHDSKASIWFVRDHAAMARVKDWAGGGRVAPFYIDMEGPVPPVGLPRPGPLSVKLRNDHLGYALTWFGLAAGLMVVFVAWAFSRLRRRQA